MEIKELLKIIASDKTKSKSIIYKVRKWFQTAPRIKSDTVLAIEEAGYMRTLLNAVEKCKRGEPSILRMVGKRHK